MFLPILIGLAVYEGIGLVVRAKYFPREPVYMASVWPVAILGARTK